MQGVTHESTPVRAFQIAYPDTDVKVSDDKTVRSVSVSFPEEQRQALDENQKSIAKAMFDAFNSGSQVAREGKILLEHPEVLGKDSGKPIEIPVTKEKLTRLGMTLDPGAYDDTPASAYAAAMSGLTHLIYDKGFVPRSEEVAKIQEKLDKEDKPEDARSIWIKQKIGEQPVDRTPERATPEQADRKVGTRVVERDKSGQTIGRGQAAYQPLTNDQSGNLVAAAAEDGATSVRMEGGKFVATGNEATLRSPVQWQNDSLFPATPGATSTGNVGTQRKQGALPDANAGGFTGEELAPRAEYESKPGYTPVQQAALNHITVEAKRIQPPLPPEATDEERVKAWESAVNQVVRQTNPATIAVAPETAHYELSADGKPQRVVTQSDTEGAPGNPSIDAVVLGREFESPGQARQALASAGYESLPQLKGPRQFIATKEANKSTFRLVKTPEGKFRLTTANKATPGLERPQKVSRRELIQIAELAKREFSSAIYARRMNLERDEINQEAGNNSESMPLRDELTEDQTLAEEGKLGISEDRAAMKDRQRGLTSSFSPAEAKGQTRRSTENAVSGIDNAANSPRDIDHSNIETVHEVSGGSTIRATGVGEKVVQFFTKALTDIGLKVPVRVTNRAGLMQHADALQQEIEALSTTVLALRDTLAQSPAMLKAQEVDKANLEKQLKTKERQLADAQTEQNLLVQAMEDSYAARVIYNDHYLNQSRRTPLIVVSDEALSSKHLARVLGHELGHVVQRAWFDQLPPDMKNEILQELSENGRYTDDIAEAFADRFYEWYERQARGDRIKQKQEDIRSSGFERVLQQLANALQRLWKNLVGHNDAFAKQYPKFDEFLRSTVGVYGKMKPINPRWAAVWRQSLSQPYGGLPLRVAEGEDFHNITFGEVEDFAKEMAEKAKARAAKFVENKIGENQVAKDYQRRLGDTYDVMKTGAEFLAMSEGFRLRHSWGGIFAGWSNIYSPEMGKALGGMQVIDGDLSTRRITGRMQNLVKRWRQRYRTRLVGIQDQISKLSEQEKKDLLDNLHFEGLPAATPLAKDIRKYFNLLHAELKASEVNVGKIRDYFPKAWNIELFADPARREDIVSRFTAVFKARPELPVKDRVKVAIKNEDGSLSYEMHDVRFETAEEAAIDMYNRIARNEVSTIPDLSDSAANEGLRSSAFPNNRPRPFSDKEYRDFKLLELLNSDISNVMQTYTDQAARRAIQQMVLGIPKAQRDQRQNAKTAEAWAKRFTDAGLDPVVMHTSTASLDLLLAEGVQDGRIPKEEYEKARSLIMSTLGQKNIGVNPRLRRWNNRIVAYQTILTMGWSMFSSLSDPGIAAWRGGSLSRAGDAFRKLLDKTTREQQEELLKTLGLAMDETTRHALQSDTTAVSDPMARGAHRATELFFKLNGMEFLSHSNMIFASLLGQSYIKDYSNQAVNGATAEIRDAAKARLAKLHPEFDPHLAMAQDFESDTQMQLALMEFISQAHLHDQQGYTPEYFQDHRFRLLTMLKGFTFKYHNIVLKQMFAKMREQPDLLHAAMPVVTLAIATMPLALLGMETKDFLRRKLMPKVQRYKEKTAAEKLHDVIMASGMPGAYFSLYDDMREAPKHGQPSIISLMGPAVGTVYNMSARTADEYLPGMTPLVSSFPWMRSQMRQGLRDTFGFGVRDEEE